MFGTRASTGSTLLSLLALIHQGLAHHWFNWQEYVGCKSTGYFVPEDEAHLVDWVKEQYALKTLLRPVGNGHGFGNLTLCVNEGETERDSYILSLSNLDHLQVNDDSTVTFGAGWDLIDLMPALQERGLQVQNLGSEKVQNYIGAATTGTHGTGKDNQNIASQIAGLRVLDTQGNIHAIDGSTPDLVNAYSIGIGAMGIVVEATIRVEPLSFVKRTSRVIRSSSTNTTELYERIASISDEYEQVTVFGPSLDWDVEKQELVLNADLIIMSWEDTDYSGSRNCSENYCANLCGPCDRDFFCYDYKNDATSTPPQGVCNRHFYTEFEHFLPIEHLVEAGTEYLEHAKSQEKRMIPYQNEDISVTKDPGFLTDDVTVITRFVKADENWLSPVNSDNLHSSASGIFFTLEYDWNSWYNNYTKMWFYEDLASEFISKFGEKYNARPHWNKMMWHNETYTEFIYPKLNRWLDIQEKMDPNCQLVNPFLIKTLGIDRCRDVFDN
ncbi:FAD/FMN-containing dehydrogenase [Geosmithia morbida]|uniref:D-arabinono-1,4-lactone oxidase n=1 Tax=Geosmithia morbida TaxID=1094350 RepID=A0A9P4YUE8_9HYPO|nr:FAD/FMN-containing dehydrogenase [Geosmithia morbida]KAF4121871.1 FAD/FMN-containing dehydrogenase [Geosmithia morbida]